MQYTGWCDKESQRKEVAQLETYSYSGGKENSYMFKAASVCQLRTNIFLQRKMLPTASLPPFLIVIPVVPHSVNPYGKELAPHILGRWLSKCFLRN